MVRRLRLVCFFVLICATGYTQILLGKYNCNGDTNGNGNLDVVNYIESKINMTDLAVTGDLASLAFTDSSVELTLTGWVRASSCLYFSIAPKDGYIVEIRRIAMNVKKDTQAGNVILYQDVTGLPFLNDNSIQLYNAGNGNTGAEYSIVNVQYPEHFTSPITVMDSSDPVNFLLSTGKDGGALSIDYIHVYGYVYKETDEPPVAGVDRNFSVDMQKKVAEVSPLFWGANFLFWIEDDAALADNKIEQSLRNMPCTVLRYPGGTVADNFHWKTTMLENNNRFPYEEGETETDFDEFIAFCQRINAEPLVVVNTESWWLRQDVEGGAQDAADWVQYCKDKGYDVKYWMIGNETYWHPHMTATEYGLLVKKYAIAMKAVNPNIIISANGHWEVNQVGVKERIDPADWDSIRQVYLNISSREEHEAAKEYRDSKIIYGGQEGSEKWWNNVADACGEYIDMLGVHWYFSGGNTRMTQKLEEVKNVFKSKFPNRDYILSMTEYNCNNDNHRLAISGLFHGIAQFLMADVEIATIWPLRNTIHGSRTSVLNPATKEVQYPYQVLRLLGNNLKGDLLQVDSEDLIFPVVSYDGNQLTVLISGRNVESMPVNAIMSMEGLADFEFLSAKSYDAPASNTNPIQLVQNDVEVNINGSSCSVTVYPFQTVMLTFKNKVNDSPLVNKKKDVQVRVIDKQLLIESKEQVQVQVYDVQGKSIHKTEGQGTMNLGVWTRGTYLIQLKTHDHVTYIRKIAI